MDWKKAFAAPFKLEGSMIFDKEDRICLNTFIDEDLISKLLGKLNGEHNKKPKEDVFSLSKDKSKIMYGKYSIFLIRGWGRLIGSGGFNLSSEEAVETQNNFANWVVKTLNS